MKIKPARRSVTKQIIIEMIAKHKDGIRWNEIRTELGISKPTLAEHLKELKKDGIIVSEKKGRNSFYKLTKHAWSDVETKIQLFSVSSLSIINKIIAGDSDSRLQQLNEYDFLEDLSRKIGALALFSILKSVEKNENWYDAATFYLQQPGGAHGLMQRKIVYPEGDMRMMRGSLENVSLLKPKIKKMYNALRKLYPKEITQLEEIYNNPREPMYLETGERPFQWGLPGRSVPLKSVRLPD